jgi:hypothetical protein
MSHASLETLDVPFFLRGRAGMIHVSVRPNHDPEDLGHPLIAVGYDEEAFRGFPCAKATVDYDGDGPRAWMGWLQVIRRHDDGGVLTESIDASPLFGAESPLYTFGYLPTFSDCPANPSHPDGDWAAHTFLVAVPDVARSRALAPVAAFWWGYRLTSGRPGTLFEPTVLSLQLWETHRSLLESHYPSWTFLPQDRVV